MALQKTTRTLCNKLVDEFDRVINPIISAKSEITSYKRDFENLLRSGNFSPDLSTVTGEIGTINNTVENLVPGNSFDDMYALKDFIDNCPYLSGLAPVSAVLGSILGVLAQIDDLLGLSTVPEIGMGRIGSNINQLLSGLFGGQDISTGLRLGDKLIQCLEALCGPGDAYYIAVATEYATDIDDLYSDLNIVGDPLSPNYGLFDFDSIYSDIGLSAQHITQVNAAITGVDGIKTNAGNAITNSVNAVKQYTKGGFFG